MGIQMSKSTHMLLKNLDRFVRLEADFQLPRIRNINSAYAFSFDKFEKAQEAFAEGRTSEGNNHLDDLRNSASSAFAKLNGGDASLVWPSAFAQILTRALQSSVENKKYTYCDAAQKAQWLIATRHEIFWLMSMYWKFVHRDAPAELAIRLKTLAEELTAHLEEYREHIRSHNSAYLWQAMRQKPEECIAAGTGYECNQGEYKADLEREPNIYGGCVCENMFRKDAAGSLNGALYSDCEVRDLDPSCENHDLQLIVHPFNEQVGGEPEYNWWKYFVQNQLRYKPYEPTRVKWNFRISPFFPGQAGSDDVSIECLGLTNPDEDPNPDWRFMRAIHNGIRFEGSRGFHDRFRLIPHGTDVWFYIWSRSEQKYIYMDKDHERGQATLVTHKKPDGGLFRIQKGTYDCAPYFWVKPPPMGEVTRTERVKRMNVRWSGQLHRQRKVRRPRRGQNYQLQ